MVVASDNGGSPAAGGNNYPLRGAKKTLFEGGVRVPAFVHSPLLAAAARGAVFTGLFHVSDWLPTLVHGAAGVARGAAGLAALPALDGVDQWAALSSPGSVSDQRWPAGWGGGVGGGRQTGAAAAAAAAAPSRAACPLRFSPTLIPAPHPSSPTLGSARRPRL